MLKIDALKRVLPLPELLVRLGLFSTPPTPGNYKCPLHQETYGSAFSVSQRNDTWLWNCYGACSLGGDEVTLLEAHLKLPRWGAIRHYASLCGSTVEERHCVEGDRKLGVRFPTDLHTGSRDELEVVATQRRVAFWAVATMQRNDVLRFGTVLGHESWIVTDGSGRCAEARRMDGAFYPALGKLGARKAHTLSGSTKSWPVGLALPQNLTRRFKKVLLVEGSGDFVAAYHFALEKGDWLPVAILGANIKKLHVGAAEILERKHVRIVPHIDDAGSNLVTHWVPLLRSIGAGVDGFDLRGLRRADGLEVKDLNDATDLVAEDAPKLGRMFAL